MSNQKTTEEAANNVRAELTKELEEEVLSLKDDWKMCDEVCDHKEDKIRSVNRLIRNVVVGKQRVSDLQDYLNNEVTAKVRADLTTELKARITDQTIIVRDKHKPFRQITNPNYKPNRRRIT